MDREDWSWALEGRWRFKPKWMLGGAGTFLNTEISINTYIVDLMYQVY